MSSSFHFRARGSRGQFYCSIISLLGPHMNFKKNLNYVPSFKNQDISQKILWLLLANGTDQPPQACVLPQRSHCSPGRSLPSSAHHTEISLTIPWLLLEFCVILLSHTAFHLLIIFPSGSQGLHLPYPIPSALITGPSTRRKVNE